MTTITGASEDRFLCVGWDMINLIGNMVSKVIRGEEQYAYHKLIVQ